MNGGFILRSQQNQQEGGGKIFLRNIQTPIQLSHTPQQ